MSTQYATGEDYPQYQAGIASGVAAQMTHTQFIAAYQGQSLALFKALNAPVSQSGNGAGLALPSVGINVANNGAHITDSGGPQRYTY